MKPWGTKSADTRACLYHFYWCILVAQKLVSEHQGGSCQEGRRSTVLWADWPREGVGLGWIWTLVFGLVCLTWATQICTRYFAGADPNSPIGTAVAWHKVRGIKSVAPYAAPTHCWIWGRLASLPISLWVRIGLLMTENSREAAPGPERDQSIMYSFVDCPFVFCFVWRDRGPLRSSRNPSVGH